MEIKIPFYNIINMFLTGLVFMGGCIMVYPNFAANMLTSDIAINIGSSPEIILIVCFFAAAYEVGLIINRIGSVVIEPILRKTKAIPFDDDYVKFNKKKKEYPIMSTLSREYVLSRTGIALFGILTAIAGCGGQLFFASGFVTTAVVYFFSGRKQAKKIVDLMCDKPSVIEKEN